LLGACFLVHDCIYRNLRYKTRVTSQVSIIKERPVFLRFSLRAGRQPCGLDACDCSLLKIIEIFQQNLSVLKP